MRTGWMIAFFSLLTALNLAAAPRQRGDEVPLRNWPVSFDSMVRGAASVSTERLRPATDTAVSSQPANFIAVTPCRIVDTRSANGAYGSPKLVGGAARSFNVPAGPCTGIPASAAAFSLNFTVLNGEGASGFLTAYPTGSTRPTVSTLNYGVGNLVANAAIVPAGTSSSVDVYVNYNVDLIIDINGYFGADLGATNLTTYTYPNPIAGSYSLTIPAGLTRILVEAWGGGGGGGYATGALPGGFGGNGGYARALIPVSSNTTLTLTIGGGGAGATVANGSGTAGGDTKIELGVTVLLTAGGGGGGAGSFGANGPGGVVSGDASVMFFQSLSASGPSALGFVAGAGGIGSLGAPAGSGKAGLIIVTFVQ